MNTFHRWIGAGVIVLLGSVVLLGAVAILNAESRTVSVKETVLGNWAEMGSWLNVVISPDCSRAAYVKADDRKNEVGIFLDGARLPIQIGRFGSIVFSPDSKRVACTGCRLDGAAASWLVWLDGKALVTYTKGVAVFGLQFSPDSARLLWFVDRGKGATIVEDGKELTRVPVSPLDGGKTKSMIGVGRFDVVVFAPDGKSLAYPQCTQLAGHVLWMMNGKPVAAPGEQLGDLVFSPDSNRFAVAVCGSDRVGHTSTMFVDGKASKPYFRCEQPVFSSDSKHCNAPQKLDRWLS